MRKLLESIKASIRTDITQMDIDRLLELTNRMNENSQSIIEDARVMEKENKGGTK
jgi:FtsZ-binding cell division protein ZapB